MNDEEIITFSADTSVVMNRMLKQGLEKDSNEQLMEGWGEVFKWMDLCAAISAFKHARGPCVTANVDDMQLINPLLFGDMLTVRGKVNCSWNTSMEVEVNLDAENLLQKTQTIRPICTSFFTFVLVKPSPSSPQSPSISPLKLPRFIPSNEEDKRKYLEAIERRRIRMKRRELINLTNELVNNVNNENNNKHKNNGENISIEGDELREKKPMSQSIVCSSILVLPPNANPSGNTFGGQIMEWMEEIARLASYKHARRAMYLRSLDDVYFIKPSTVGDCLTLKAQVNRVFGTTLEVGVRVEAISFAPSSGSVTRHINSGYFTYSTLPPHITTTSLKISEADTPLPLIFPESDQQERQFNAAIGRRRIRFERKAIRTCSVKSFTPVWSTHLSAELIYSNIQCLIKVAMDKEIAWWETKNNDNIRLWIHETTEETLCKLEMTLTYKEGRATIDQLFEMILRPHLRIIWDTQIEKYKIVEQIDETNEIVYSVFGKEGAIQCDFSLLRSWRSPSNSSQEANSDNYYIANRSVIHNELPEVEAVKRGFILPSGFILSNVIDKDGKKTNDIKVIYVIQVGECSPIHSR